MGEATHAAREAAQWAEVEAAQWAEAAVEVGEEAEAAAEAAAEVGSEVALRQRGQGTKSTTREYDYPMQKARRAH